MLNIDMITASGIRLEYQYTKHLSSAWQAITNIANKNNLPIIEVFYCLEIGERLEVLREVESATKNQSTIK
jgi:hypothetical protein